MSTRFRGSQEHQHGSSSTTQAAGLVATFKDKSVDELRKLLSNKDAYQQFLNSLEEVKIQNHVTDELCKENLQLADENLRKEPRIVELSNQAERGNNEVEFPTVPSPKDSRGYE
ncbi:vacuolar protein-sorting-associated protein 37 homolog 2 isoform X2 [Vigna angularis]|uniref:vacuolar protein-sorting-associated protein 37 homolog 2 isoform X2 n=1 Tax=Phaseolus angularis TaxID=3914 RepID=UPI0022B3FD5D|nr:vacuolar protein-sorting-associated protein 37 homolog 2 isoform X2 [Vigna angularis]